MNCVISEDTAIDTSNSSDSETLYFYENEQFSCLLDNENQGLFGLLFMLSYFYGFFNIHFNVFIYWVGPQT